MPLASIIQAIISTGIQVAPRIIAFFQELHGNDAPPTQEQIDAVWARHQEAYRRIMAEDASTHPQ